MEWYLKCLRQYADFNGRARRKEYWMFVLFNVIFALGLAFLGGFIGGLLGGEEVAVILGYGLYLIYCLVIFIPALAVAVRRLHDVGKSGWWIFISLIPIIGSIWLLILMVTDSVEENQYGKYPK